MTSLEHSDKSDQRTTAHVGPFVIFMAFLALPDLLITIDFFSALPDAPWYRAAPRQWIYPLQSVVCLAALWYWRKQYEFRPHRNWLLAAIAGILGITIWIIPGYLFHRWQLPEGWWKYLGCTQRSEGFNPYVIRDADDWIYLVVIALRFVRLVLVVPLVEEIFWRGFLMRFVTDLEGDYWRVPFGTFHWRSVIVVTALFVLVHAPTDYFGATIYGLLAYYLTVRTKSLSAVIIMHAVANLLLGIYVMITHQWGYW